MRKSGKIATEELCSRFGKREFQNMRKCLKCEYKESCRYLADSPELRKNRAETSYFDENIQAEVNSIPAVPEGETSERVYTEAEMVTAISYLLRLDNYTLDILSHVLSRGTTQSVELARHYGVSRQAIHNKFNQIMVQYPELVELLKGHLIRFRKRAAQSRKRAKQQR